VVVALLRATYRIEKSWARRERTIAPQAMADRSHAPYTARRPRAASPRSPLRAARTDAAAANRHVASPMRTTP
jgi:hypothetical protein